MKKQILFLTFFVTAILAGMNSYGQYSNYPETPVFINDVALTCADNITELNPLPGELYTYTITTTSVTDDVRWFVINNNDLATASPVDSIIETTGTLMDVNPWNVGGTGGPYVEPADGTGPYILGLGTSGFVNYNYNPVPTALATDDGVSANTAVSAEAHSIEIRWKSFDGLLDNEVLLVAMVSDAAGCTNNIEVYRIVPKFLFTLDLAALSQAGDSIGSPVDGSDDAFECVSPIEHAWYNATTNVPGEGQLTVDYGENWVYFAVNAANFVDSWMPRFQISHNYGGTAGNTDYIEASWAYGDDNFADGGAATQTWYPLTGSGVDWSSAAPVIAGGVDGSYAVENTVGLGVSSLAGGENIIVRVRLDWDILAENAVNDVILSFAVDGVMFDPQETAASAITAQFDFANIALLDLGEDINTYDSNTDGACDYDNFDYDVMDYTITPRPQVITNTGTTPEPFELNTGDNNAGTPTVPNDGTN